MSVLSVFSLLGVFEAFFVFKEFCDFVSLGSSGSSRLGIFLLVSFCWCFDTFMGAAVVYPRKTFTNVCYINSYFHRRGFLKYKQLSVV